MQQSAGRPGFLLNQAVLTINGRVDRALAPSLTGAQWAVVYLLHEHRVSTVSQLARALGTDVAATWRLVGRLVDKGYVARRPDPADRRVVRLDLAPAALAAYPAWRTTVAATLDRLLEGVATEDLVALNRVLSGLIANGLASPAPARAGSAHDHSTREGSALISPVAVVATG